MVVFEGLDRTGKSTQLALLEGQRWSRTPVFTHMPSGFTSLTSRIYALTETEPMSSVLGRQLLHLACHAENMDVLLEGRDRAGVVLDRWWWSTIAYGWYGGGLAEVIDESVYRGMVDAVWSRLTADVVFLFDSPLGEDRWNVAGVEEGYLALAAEHPHTAVRVPILSVDDTARFVLEALEEHGLLELGDSASSRHD